MHVFGLIFSQQNFLNNFQGPRDVKKQQPDYSQLQVLQSDVPCVPFNVHPDLTPSDHDINLVHINKQSIKRSYT